MQQLEIRETYRANLSRICAEFAESRDGIATTRAITGLAEDQIGHLFSRCLSNQSESSRTKIATSIAIAAIGGFARRELCPYSDVDLLILHIENPPAEVESFIAEFVRGVWDSGLSLGQNVGSPKQLVSLAKKEVLPATSFLNARILLGESLLFESFTSKYQRFLSGSGGQELFLRGLAAVQEEQKKYGATVHLLEPNVKRSAGGLRDIHVIYWAGSALHGEPDFGALESRGSLGSGDGEGLQSALSFLIRLRCDLHFHAGKAHDDLLRVDQVRIADAWGYSETPGRLAVEYFMADYFRHTTSVADILERFVERTRPRSLMTNAREILMTRRVGEGVSIGPDRLILAAKERREASGRLERILELAELAARHKVRFDHNLTESLRRNHLSLESRVGEGPPEALSAECAERFLRFLSSPGTQAQILRALHRTGVLSRIVPEFEHARCLLQFNAYHKYTVDEHTFVVIENLESLADRTDVVGRAYRAVQQKSILHLAALLHDLGKGHQENHSEVGYRIAVEVADRLGLSAEERETLAFLVHRHLLMSDLALKRDTSDPKVWVTLGKEVGDAQRLKMLYCLTVADIMGVGPGVYSQWTADLLEDLYRNTLSVLGEVEDAASSIERWESRRQVLLESSASSPDTKRIIEALPTNYLAEVDAVEIEQHLAIVRGLTNGQVEILPVFRPETQTTTYTVLTSERASASVFSKICGGLAAHRMDVLRARIYTLSDGTVIDQFDVRDTHYFGDPSPDRVKKVASTIQRILTGELSVLDALYSTRSSMFGAHSQVQRPVDTRVSLDNTISESCTVIDVFTNNRRGLLYTLAQGLVRLGLSVHYAKIATYEDEAADVFYVRDRHGSKVVDPARIREIEERLASDVRALAENPRAMGF